MDGDKAKKAAGKKDGSKTSFSWSREEDFEQRRRFTPQASPLFRYISTIKHHTD